MKLMANRDHREVYCEEIEILAAIEEKVEVEQLEKLSVVGLKHLLHDEILPTLIKKIHHLRLLNMFLAWLSVIQMPMSVMS